MPEAVGLVIASGITVHDLKGFLASLRLRYFGPRDLTSDGIYRSKATALLNGEVGYRISEEWRVSAEFLNLLDRSDHDIDYAYESQIDANCRSRHSQTCSTRSNRFRSDSGWEERFEKCRGQ